MSTVLEYTIQLDGKPGSPNKKYTCPSCGQKSRFRRYYNYQTKEYLGDDVGLCDRPRCGYHYTPKMFFEQNPDKRIMPDNNRQIVYAHRSLVHFPPQIMIETLSDYDDNSFIKPLMKIFTKQQIEQAIGEYYLGTIEAGFKKESLNNKSVVFWFIDRKNNIRAGQAKLFTNDCRTEKYISSEGEKRNYQTWMHSLLSKQYKNRREDLPEWLQDYNDSDKVTCLFGEHLLNKYPGKPVALVEAPKTAFIASIAYPEFVWLATSSLSYLTKERCRILSGRKVVLFPDCGIPNPKTGKTCLSLWQERIAEFAHIADFSFSTLLEDNATIEEKEAGFDVADLLLRDLAKQPFLIESKDIEHIPCETHTGKDFGNLILATAWLRDGKRFDILFDKNGELITMHEKIQPLATFFDKTFIPAKIDGLDCLINIVNN